MDKKQIFSRVRTCAADVRHMCVCDIDITKLINSGRLGMCAPC